MRICVYDPVTYSDFDIRRNQEQVLDVVMKLSYMLANYRFNPDHEQALKLAINFMVSLVPRVELSEKDPPDEPSNVVRLRSVA